MATFDTVSVSDDWGVLAASVTSRVTLNCWGAANDTIEPLVYVMGMTSATTPTDKLGAIQLSGAAYISDTVANIWPGVTVTDIYAKTVKPGATVSVAVIAD